MGFDIINYSYNLINKQTADKILRCNDFTAKYGLMLTEKQALDLAKARVYSLKENGRVEFGTGIIDKLIKEFCDSPFIHNSDYAETLQGLIDAFYYFKNETLDRLSDDALIKYMKKAFDGPCQGSLELLLGTELERLARNIRYGYPIDYNEEAETGDEHE